MAERETGEELPLVLGDPHDDVTHWIGRLDKTNECNSDTTRDPHIRPPEAEG